jgi:hypothetical protein
MIKFIPANATMRAFAFVSSQRTFHATKLDNFPVFALFDVQGDFYHPALAYISLNLSLTHQCSGQLNHLRFTHLNGPPHFPRYSHLCSLQELIWDLWFKQIEPLAGEKPFLYASRFPISFVDLLPHRILSDLYSFPVD